MRRWIALILLATLATAPANAVVVSRQTDFVPHTKAEADEVDAEFDNILSAINGNLSSENILDGSIATADLASSAVITAKINDSAVTTAKINDLAVTTAKIATANVTRPKLEAVGQQLSPSTGVLYAIGGGTNYYTATGISVSITSSGRPIFVGLNGAEATAGSTTPYIASTAAECQIRVTRSGVESFRTLFAQNVGSGQTNLPPSIISHLDATAAGTYTYQLQALSSSGGNCIFNFVKLLVYEL